MVNRGGIPLDSEALRLSGCYAHIARTAKMLSAMQAELPKLIVDSADRDKIIHQKNIDNYLAAFDILKEKDRKGVEILGELILDDVEKHLLNLKARVNALKFYIIENSRKSFTNMTC
jgi:hypothetical protein